ncbi:glycoside hydrolase family 3 N-terminal domain-containing protein [Nocardia sp. 348MFTsu5.1]|uniref:glycoside hydrolase family 3 N-terminal domain-containing protein n=1 Tax=Nocardia sp. 348MFTsu5.1 TaxID=1172185 RepID=UPI0003A1516A|nr:glycoside hydrolase family 3 N-terminal domain-containing protein [Nocardia sp. 348MFTsu5.1]
MFAEHRSRRALAALTITIASVVAACSGAGDEPEVLLSAPDSGVRSPASTATSAEPSGTPMVTPTSCGATELESMSLRRKLAQLLVVGVTGTADALDVVETEQIGGIFVGSWTDLSILSDGGVKSVQSAAKTPVMVTVDQEGGRVSRLSPLGIDSPSARELVQSGQTPEEVRALAKSQGLQMKELGVTVDFAPVADVSDEPADDVIGDRSFSDDPQTVAIYAEAYAQGLTDAGIMPVFKHFPGHGHGSGDSHTGNVATPPLSELQTNDLVPYRTLVGPGVGVMVGHLIVPGLTEPDTPASISPAAMSLLRGGTGYAAPPFDGPIFTDDLSGMAAISARYGIEKAATMALSAGADIALWLSTNDVPAVLDTLTAAVENGELPADQVDASVVRVLRAKNVLDC